MNGGIDGEENLLIFHNMTWSTKKLGEVCDFQNGLWTGKKPPFVTTNVIRNTNFKNNDGTLNLGDVAEIEVEERQLKNRLLEKGDLILERSGGGPTQPVGRVVYFDADGEFSFSNFTSRIRVKNPKELDSEYLWRCLNYFYLSGMTENLQKQTTGIRNLNFSEYKELEISLPPVGEQRKIVEKIEKLFTKINEAQRLRAESLTASAALLPSALHHIFNSKFKIQNAKLQFKVQNWEEKKIGEILEFKYGKGIPRYDRKPNGKYSIYGANGELGRTDKFLVEGDALIIGRKGSAGEVTRVAGKFWPSDVTYYVLGNNRINVDYLFYVLKKVDLRQLAIGVKPGINRNRAYEIKIPLPPVAEQKKIVEYLDSLSAKARALQSLQQETKNDLSALRQSVLQQAFDEQTILSQAFSGQ